MKTRKIIFTWWCKLRITAKFSLGFGILLALILLVAATGYMSLRTVRLKSEAAIFNSTEIQRLVLEMDGELQAAHRLVRDFFLRYPLIGFSEARQKYVNHASEHIARVIELSSELRVLISESGEETTLQQGKINLNFYFSAANRYKVSFKEAVELVRKLADNENGFHIRLTQNSMLIQKMLQTINIPDAIILYREMESFGKDYLITRKRPFMQSAFNSASELRRVVENSALIKTDQKKEIFTYLDNYLAVAREIIQVDVAVTSKLNEFELQADAAEPVSTELTALATREVEQARVQIKKTSRFATIILAVTSLAGLVLAVFIARVLNNSITMNVLRLTRATSEFQKKWESETRLASEAVPEAVFVRTESSDELGQLADSFNAMTMYIYSLVSSLESKVAERTRDLSQALEHLKAAQDELIESEKMAALGQLVAGVAHEINSPFGAIRSSVENISKTLKQTLVQLPDFFRLLSPESKNTFFAMLERSFHQERILSAKEERECKRMLIRKLGEYNIKNSSDIANRLIIIGIYENIDPFFSLFYDKDNKIILDMVYKLAGLQRNIRIASIAAERVSKIVFALKTYAHSGISGEIKETDIAESIETVLTLYYNQLKHGVSVVRHYEENLPLILCYPDEMNQVWTNLIHNALQAMEYNGILTVDVFKEYDMLVVKIADTGKGIPDKAGDKIFNPFFTTKRPGEGSGLGLNIVKKIVDKHHGKINVESEVGKGAAFSISLPLNQPYPATIES
ncbi:MAG: GHKL domain-containing protein [Desulfobacterales bacterium]|nr:GHKL domain-containing protein [Desulfobacterales bacterium]